MADEADPRIAQLEAEVSRLRERLARAERGRFFGAAEATGFEPPPGFADTFAEASLRVARFFSEGDVDPSEAKLRFGGERYVLVRASALSIDFLDTISQLYADRGPKEAAAIGRSFLFDVAHTIGRNDAKRFHEIMNVTDPIARLSDGPFHFAYTGWGVVRVDPRSHPVPTDDYCLVYDHPSSFEASSHLEAGRASDAPVCILGAAYSSGWCEQSFGIELTSVEVECRAKGDPTCRFVMAPPGRVHERLAEHFGVAVPSRADGKLDVPTYFERKRIEEELHQSLERLGRAQAELVERERLATVGLLVSGVAHDINTPLGVAVTAASVVHGGLEELRDGLAAGKLGRARVAELLHAMTEADAMVRRNLERAADLVLDFKRVSVDHTTEEARTLDLVAHVGRTLASLAPIAKRGGLAVEVRGASAKGRTHPGAIAQILTNFLTNTAEHGKVEGREIAVRVDVSERDGRFTLVYADDGRGMTKDVAAKMFQPFFTTRRGLGGTGLGLHVVATLVRDVLRGTLDVATAEGAGARFTIVFPFAP